MPALKKTKPVAEMQVKTVSPTDSIRPVGEAHGRDPIASPARKLQQALHDAGYRSDAFQERPMSNVMLVLSVICVYALAMMMTMGAISA